jgi:hypothetical protein
MTSQKPFTRQLLAIKLEQTKALYSAITDCGTPTLDRLALKVVDIFYTLILPPCTSQFMNCGRSEDLHGLVASYSMQIMHSLTISGAVSSPWEPRPV